MRASEPAIIPIVPAIFSAIFLYSENVSPISNIKIAIMTSMIAVDIIPRTDLLPFFLL